MSRGKEINLVGGVTERRLMRDLVGRKARLTAILGNSLGVVPAGTNVTITSTHKGGVCVRTNPCECCKLSLYVTKVSLEHLEFWHEPRKE